METHPKVGDGTATWDLFRMGRGAMTIGGIEAGGAYWTCAIGEGGKELERIESSLAGSPTKTIARAIVERTRDRPLCPEWPFQSNLPVGRMCQRKLASSGPVVPSAGPTTRSRTSDDRFHRPRWPRAD